MKHIFEFVVPELTSDTERGILTFRVDRSQNDEAFATKIELLSLMVIHELTDEQKQAIFRQYFPMLIELINNEGEVLTQGTAIS